MGRAQGGQASAAASPRFHTNSPSPNQDPFTALLGSQRGLSAAQASASAEAAQQRFATLQEEVSANQMDNALRELVARASEVESDPLLNELLTGVAHALTDHSHRAQDEKSRDLLAALLIEPRHADHLLIHYGTPSNTLNTLHIWPSGAQSPSEGDAHLEAGTRSRTACGMRFAGPTSIKKVSPFSRARRGAWQQPPADVTHCVSCFRHENDYADCAVASSSPPLGERTNLEIHETASAFIRTQINQRVQSNEGVGATELAILAEEAWRDEFLLRLSAHAVDGGEPLLQRLLGKHYAYYQRKFGASRRLLPDRPLAELLDAAAWRDLSRELLRYHQPRTDLAQRLAAPILQEKARLRGW